MSTIVAAALAGAEQLINKALQYDPATQQGLRALSGNILAVQLTNPALTLYVSPLDDELQLMSHCDGDVDTRISGSWLALAQLAHADTHTLKDSGVSVMGNTAFLGELQKLLKQVDIDWEEMLSQLAGDIVGPQMASIIRAKFQWTRARAESAARLTREFLTEELGTLPHRVELHEFYTSVDDLRFAVDRIQARVDALRTKRHSTS